LRFQSWTQIVNDAPEHREDEDWEAEDHAIAGDDRALVVDVDGFAGPLDLLLALARAQKLDLARISILALARQYLAFIDRVRDLRLEIAADYLVMAAWLAFLKSKLLLPREDEGDGEPTGAELAARLAFRLQRLEAMRNAAANLMARDRLGRDRFARGSPEATRINRENRYEATIYDMLRAYADQRQRRVCGEVRITRRTVWSLRDARERLERLLGGQFDWAPLDAYLARYLGESEDERSAIASSFGATLQMAREGLIEIRQTQAFAPIYIRRPGARRDPVEPGLKLVGPSCDQP